MRIASNTKTFVAATAVSLAHGGLFDLDRPIEAMLPGPLTELLAARYDPGVITPRMLLRHTSGITEHCAADAAGTSAYLRAARTRPLHRWTPTEQIRFSLEHFGPGGAAGAAVRYSDTGYVVLGQLIEHLTGRPLPAVVRERCRLDALGLDHTWWESLEPGPYPEPRRLHVRLGDDDWEGVDCSFDLFGGGGLVSTVGDLATWWRALFARRVLPDAALAELLTVQGLGGPGCDGDGDGDGDGGTLGEAGLGIFRRRVAGRSWWTHRGLWGSLVLHDADGDCTVTMFDAQAAEPGEALEELGAALAAA
jgi:D-alanyl-D-alanine carboxypeptidase